MNYLKVNQPLSPQSHFKKSFNATLCYPSKLEMVNFDLVCKY